MFLRILQEDGLVSRWVAVPREVWKVGGGGHYLAQVMKCDRRAGQVVLCYKVPQLLSLRMMHLSLMKRHRPCIL